MENTKPPRKPVPQDFGLTEQQYIQAKTNRERHAQQSWLGTPDFVMNRLFAFIGGLTLAVYMIAYLRDREWFLNAEEAAAFWVCAPLVILFGTTFIHAVFLESIITDLYLAKEDKKRREDPVFTKTLAYERAMASYDQAAIVYSQSLEEHWRSLRGVRLENELASLYRRLGYVVSMTKATGDAGIDLILEKDCQTTVVQCKGHSKPVGVAAARDLYGTLVHCEADSAILACPAGFTKGVCEFVTDKPIRLVSAGDLVALGEGAEQRTEPACI